MMRGDHCHAYFFPIVATGINMEVCHFDVASGPFKCHFIAVMSTWYFEEILLERVHKAY